ncbi:MAG: protein phosphatase CheZ [Desulfovibrio sp.]|nr:protein phosphatase CheZ [Desulfovibrio sp.]
MSEQKRQEAVYRQLSADMRQGLKDIYQQISTASAADGAAPATDALFHEASAQLDEVLRDTEAAAMSIMEIVEKQLELQAESAELIAAAGEAPGMARLAAINDELGSDLTTLLTTLSFQDITGQRIKKVVTALNGIERQVVDLYVASGLVMDGAEKDPAKDAQTLQDEARQAVADFRESRKQPQAGGETKAAGSELKGPDKNGVSQAAIDDMLAQLGF